jgi:hypothetical protein
MEVTITNGLHMKCKISLVLFLQSASHFVRKYSPLIVDMSLNEQTGYLNIDNAHLRVEGNIVAENIELGNIQIGPTYGLSSVTDVGNTTSQTVQFTNAATGLVTTGNVAVGKELTVTGNVTVGKELTVTGNVTMSEELTVTGNVEVGGDMNLLHTANTVSIKLNSNVVTEFPRSKKLIKYPRVALTSAASTTSGYQGYKVSSSYFYPGYHYDWEAFDNGGDSVGWHTADGALRAYSGSGGTYAGTLQTRLASNTELGEWLQIQLPDAIRLERYVITPQGSPGSWTNCPTSAVVYGSNDGTTWKEVHRYTDAISDGAGSTTFPFDANSTETYNHFALVVTKRDGAANGISVQEWELFGLPEYDPDADGVDVKVASYPNVPNTDWLEVYYDAKDLADGAVTSVDDLTPGGTKDGTATGNLTVSDGVFAFDGTNDYITSSTLSSHFTGDPTVTYACWVKFNAMSTNQMFFTVNAPGIYGQGVIGGLLLGTDGTLYNTAGNRGIKALEKLVTNQWYHLVATKIPGNTGLDTQKLYIDGLPVSAHIWNASGNQVIGSNPVLRIGASGTGTDRMNGSMANARLFNRALTTDEVWQLYSYQKDYFGHGNFSMTLKAGRLGIGTSEPKAALDVKGVISFTEDSFDIRYSSDAQWPASTGYPTSSYSGDDIGSQFMWRTLGSSGGEYFLYHVPRNGILMLNLTMLHRLVQFRSGQTTHAVYWNLRKSTDNGATWNTLTSRLIGHRWVNTTSWDQEWHPVTIPFTGRVNEGDQVALFVYVEWSGTTGSSSATGNFQVYDVRMRGVLI